VVQIRPASAVYILMPAAVVRLDSMTCPTSLRLLDYLCCYYYFFGGGYEVTAIKEKLKRNGKRKQKRKQKRKKKKYELA
jgi:hypothetical protein